MRPVYADARHQPRTYVQIRRTLIRTAVSPFRSDREPSCDRSSAQLRRPV